jgi:(1->4)-alpha-D-glucan 1-alpha-D-glucosylmutase
VLQQWLARPQDASLKLFTITQALRFRQQNPSLFRSGSYTPLFGSGKAAQHVCAFARELTAGSRQSCAIVAVPRLSYTLAERRLQPPTGDVWGETEISLPPRTATEFENVFTGEVVRATPSRALLCREVFANFPIALLSTR